MNTCDDCNVAINRPRAARCYACSKAHSNARAAARQRARYASDPAYRAQKLASFTRWREGHRDEHRERVYAWRERHRLDLP